MSAKILFTLIGASSPGTQPLNTSLLSAVCLRAGHEVDLFDTTFIDLGFELDTEVSQRISQFKNVDHSRYNLVRDGNIDGKRAFIDKIKKFKPAVICASAMSDMFYYTRTFLDYMKNEGYDIPVISGGIHSTLQPDDTMSHKCIDYTVVGEGEDVILPLIDSILDKKEISPLTDVPIWYRKNGEIVKTIGNKLVDLDDLPFLNLDFYDNRQFYRPFRGELLRSGDVQTMRGCPKRCSYCANAELNKMYAEMDGWTGWRTYTPERFVEEAKYLSKTYNLEFFKFYDEDMLLRPTDDMAKLSELYKKEVNIPFTMQCHPNSVSAPKAKLLKNMNCASVTISMECGNYHYRKNILKRQYTNEKFCQSVKTIMDAGVRCAALTMIGLPYESRDMIFETIELGRVSKPSHTNANIFFPYLGTPLGEVAADAKFVNLEEVRISKFDASRTLLDMPQIKPKEVEAIRRLWSFYIGWPKFLFPFFKWLEKETKIRKVIYNLLQKFEYRLKLIRKHN